MSLTAKNPKAMRVAELWQEVRGLETSVNKQALLRVLADLEKEDIAQDTSSSLQTPLLVEDNAADSPTAQAPASAEPDLRAIIWEEIRLAVSTSTALMSPTPALMPTLLPLPAGQHEA